MSNKCIDNRIVNLIMVSVLKLDVAGSCFFTIFVYKEEAPSF